VSTLSSWRHLGYAAVAAALAVAPGLANACPVCGGGANDKTQFGFLVGSILLSVLPLALVGGLAWVVVRRVRRIEAEQVGETTRASEPRFAHSAASPQAR
jgi:hypothetical protein